MGHGKRALQEIPVLEASPWISGLRDPLDLRWDEEADGEKCFTRSGRLADLSPSQVIWAMVESWYRSCKCVTTQYVLSSP